MAVLTAVTEHIELTEVLSVFTSDHLFSLLGFQNRDVFKNHDDMYTCWNLNCSFSVFLVFFFFLIARLVIEGEQEEDHGKTS